MLKIGDRVVYWYRMDREGTVVGYVKDPASTVWLEGAAPAAATRIMVKFDNGEELAYPVSDLRLVE